MENVIIIGSGPAGFTAALYAARAELSPLVITGNTLGGQLSLTSEIENFPGFPQGLGGQELMDLMRQQAERFGARVEYDLVEEVNLSRHPFWLKTQSTTYEAKALIITTGSSPRLLNIPGEAEFFGRGVSTCATCDGFFYKDRVVAVVGGGDSAMEEGIFLTRFAQKVYIIHRRDKLRASQIMQSRAMKNEKITFIWDTIVTEVLGEEGKGVQGLRLKNVKSGEESTLAVDGFFIAIGHVPNTKLFEGQLELDEHGYIVTDRRQHTSVPGVFAGGDVQDPIFRQAITAAGTGCAAAMEAEKFIRELED
ncbi:MAG: thioredoxin-disulfide reductase [Nitrospinota bacterium]|nr:MAG: thioredoxin-disulfide reductase [Nitrospinota bacterium]